MTEKAFSDRSLRNLLLWAFSFLAIIFAAFCRLESVGIANTAPLPGDSQDYDMLAVSLLHGNGFSNHWSDPEWRAPYALAAEETEYPELRRRYSDLLKREGPVSSTAYRQPGYPFFLALSYLILGRNFSSIYILQLALCGALCAALVCLINRHFTPITAVLLLIAIVLDPLPTRYSFRILTEPFVIMLMCAQLIVAAKVIESKWPGYLIVHAAVSLLMIMTRANLLIYLPIWLLFFLPCRLDESLVRRRFGLITVWLIIVLTGPAAWALRNYSLSGHWLPLGTQGQINLVAGYSDVALQSAGLWRWDLVEDSFTELINVSPRSVSDEVENGNKLSQVAYRWIRDHPTRIPTLVWIKLRSLLWDHAHPVQIVFLIFAAIGTIHSLHSRFVQLCAGLTLAQFASVALTYNAIDGRFLLPIHPCLWVCSALGASSLISRFCKLCRPTIAGGHTKS